MDATVSKLDSGEMDKIKEWIKMHGICEKSWFQLSCMQKMIETY